MTIKTPASIVRNVLAARKQAKYDAYIAEAQAHLAETTLVPGYTKIYA